MRINDNEEIENKNISASSELLSLINEWANSWIKSRQLVIQIVELAQKEGLDELSLRLLIEFALKQRGLSIRQARRLMPSELKDSSKIHVAEPESRGHFDEIDSKKDTEDYDTDEEIIEIPPEDENLPVTFVEDLKRDNAVIQFLENRANGETCFFFDGYRLKELKELIQEFERNKINEIKYFYYELL